MPAETDSPITGYLAAWKAGDRAGLDDLFRDLYSLLQSKARAAMRGEGPQVTLSAADLLHEVWTRLAGLPEPSFENRRRFFAFLAIMMRRVIVDHARARGAAIRGGERVRVTLKEADRLADAPSVDILAVDAALEKLHEISPLAYEVVHHRFFLGHTEAELVTVLAVPRARVQRQWAFAKRWLAAALKDTDPKETT